MLCGRLKLWPTSRSIPFWCEGSVSQLKCFLIFRRVVLALAQLLQARQTPALGSRCMLVASPAVCFPIECVLALGQSLPALLAGGKGFVYGATACRMASSPVASALLGLSKSYSTEEALHAKQQGCEMYSDAPQVQG